MKKALILLAAAALCPLYAEVFNVDSPMSVLKQAWRDGTMTGKNSHAAVINGKQYPDLWQYWHIESGNTPDDIKLAPLIAVSPDSQGAKAWKKYQPILAAEITEDGQGFKFPALLRNSMTVLRSRKSRGCAYSLKNPFNEEVTLYVEGRLLHNKDAVVFLYMKHADGSAAMLAEDNNPDAVEEISNTWPDGRTAVRHYLKLQVEAKMKPGDMLVIAGIRPDNAEKPVGKKGGGIFKIDGWGKAYNPVISFEK